MKPIIFNTEMVKAILDGRKTHTRRVVNKEYLGMADIEDNKIYVPTEDGGCINILNTTWSKYKVGDILYVRETFNTFSNITMDNEVGVIYKADNKEVILPCNRDYECEYVFNDKWKPSIHMPKKYARIFLKITNVRVERLQDITAINMDSDMGTISPIISKLIAIDDYIELQNKYKKYWNSTTKNGYKWEDNLYVFVYELERIENNKI